MNFPRWKLLKLKQGGFSIHQQGFQVGAGAMLGVLKPHHGAFTISQNTQNKGKKWEGLVLKMRNFASLMFGRAQKVSESWKMQRKLPWKCLAGASGCWVIRKFYIFALVFSGLKLIKIESKTSRNHTVRVPSKLGQLNNVGCDSMKWSLKLPIVDPGFATGSLKRKAFQELWHRSYIPK